MSADRERAPWWGVALPPVEGNPPQPRPTAPSGLWDGPPDGPRHRSTSVYGPPPATLPATPSLRPDAGGSRSRRTLWFVGLVAALTGAVVGGVVGGVVGAVVDGDDNQTAVSAPLTNPAITLPVSEPSVSRAEPPGSVAGIAAAVLPSVVTVHIRTSNAAGTGSGVVISSDGYILTNNHVVALDAKASGKLTVDLDAAHTNITARIVGRSPLDDLAVIKIDATALPAARLGRSGDLRVGDLVVAVGAPLGLSGSVTSGIVSALERNIEVPSEDGASTTVLGNAIQTDAAINPGNSGGALVNADGSVVGINSAIASTSDGDTPSGSIGVGFAIPIDYARKVAQEIIRTGKATHPFLGIVPRSVSLLDDGPAIGAVVGSVTKDSPAAKAGLRAGDVIVRLNDQLISNADDLVGAARTHEIGETVTVTYIRSGKTSTAAVKLGLNPNG
jgi:putative serine protease PepD